MAEEAEEEKKKGGLGSLIMILVIAISAVCAGVSTPYVVAQLRAPVDVEDTSMDEPDLEEEVAFIPFGSVTVNLEEARFARFLRLDFQLQVAKSQKSDIEQQVKDKEVVFKNWIQIHLAEKSTDDLKGTFGRNRVRREMQDFFNQELFDDGIERIQDVLFEEFHIQ